MARIIGNMTAMPNPRPDWNQTDETKADYIKNKPSVARYDNRAQISIVDITTSKNPGDIEVKDYDVAQTIIVNSNTNININYQGEADIVIASPNASSAFTISIDNVLVQRGPTMGFEWEGNIREGIRIRAGAGTSITFERFWGKKYTEGFMTGEQAEKLENTYTIPEVDALLSDHTHNLAGKVIEDVSLVDITTSTIDVISIEDKKITCGTSNTTFIDIQGNIEFEFELSGHNLKFYVDDKLLGDYNESSMTYAGDRFYSGYIERGITIEFNMGCSINFIKFNKTIDVDGFMSAEQAEKLENTYTMSETDKLLDNKSKVNHTHELAGTKVENISLTDLANETSGSEVVIESKSINLGTNGKVKFFVSGHIRFKTKGVFPVYLPNAKIDGSVVEHKETGEEFGGTLLIGYEFDGDVVESIEFISNGSDEILIFETFEKVDEKNGFMSAERAKKLDDINLIDSDAVNTLLQDFENNSETAPSWSGVNTTMDEWTIPDVEKYPDTPGNLPCNGDDSNVIQLDANGKIVAGAFGSNSVALNGKGQAKGGKSFVAGSKSVALGNNSAAFGNGTFAAGQHSFTEGNTTSALGNGSHAEGSLTVALGANAHAEGYNTKANGNFSHSEGANTTADNDYSHTEGLETEATGLYSHAEGNNSKAKKPSAHAEGTDNVASGTASHAEGYSNEVYGDYSHVEGNDNLVDGSNAHAEGWKNTVTANANYSHAEGVDNDISGTISHAEGHNNDVSGNYSHVEGGNNEATNSYVHIEGHDNIASGYGAHVEGGNNNAKGAYNHVNGFGNISDGNYQTVVGRANKEDITKAFVVGNGELGGVNKKDEDGNDILDEEGNPIEDIYAVKEENRSNAMSVDWYGNAEFAGDVTFTVGDKQYKASELLNSANHTHENAGTIKQISLTDIEIIPNNNIQYEVTEDSFTNKAGWDDGFTMPNVLGYVEITLSGAYGTRLAVDGVYLCKLSNETPTYTFKGNVSKSLYVSSVPPKETVYFDNFIIRSSGFMSGSQAMFLKDIEEPAREIEKSVSLVDLYKDGKILNESLPNVTETLINSGGSEPTTILIEGEVKFSVECSALTEVLVDNAPIIGYNYEGRVNESICFKVSKAEAPYGYELKFTQFECTVPAYKGGILTDEDYADFVTMKTQIAELVKISNAEEVGF